MTVKHLSKRLNISLSVALFVFVFTFVLSSNTYAEGEYTVADVIDAQSQNSGDVRSLSAGVESLTEYGGKSQALSYDYVMQSDNAGNNKVMVTTNGIFTMQFLVDTSDMSVTYLMADGSHVRVTADADVQAEVQKIAGIGGLNGYGKGGSVYAALAGTSFGKKSFTDAGYASRFDTNHIETDELDVKVKGRKKGGSGLLGFLKDKDDFAEVEYTDKKTGKMNDEWDKAIEKVRSSKAKNKAGETLKEQSVAWFNKSKDKAIRGMIAKRVEKINMKTGMVEEQEMYNLAGEKIGHMRVKGKKRSKIRKQSPKLTAQGDQEYLKTIQGEKEIELPEETEVESGMGNEKSRIITKINNHEINTPVEFKWMQVKKTK